MTQVIPLAAFLEGNEHPIIFEHVILDSANGNYSQLRRDSLLQCSLERSAPQQDFPQPAGSHHNIHRGSSTMIPHLATSIFDGNVKP